MEILEFKSELEPELLKFIKVAIEQKENNKFCDLNKHKVWKKIIPMNEELERKACEILTISLLESDDEENPESTLGDKIMETSVNSEEDYDEEMEISNLVAEFNKLNDLASVIKENLETRQVLSDNVLKDLESQQENEGNLEEVFEILVRNLKSEDVYNLGTCIQKEFSETCIINLFYLKFVLLPTLKSGYWENLGILVQNYIAKSPLELRNELRKSPNLIILQYVKHFNNNFKSEILSDFVNDLNKIADIHLQVIENLLNSSADGEILKKLLIILSNCCENYTEDKMFGRITANILQFLNQDCMELETPIRRIANSHKSIWKSKILKHFNNNFHNSMTFTQYY